MEELSFIDKGIYLVELKNGTKVYVSYDNCKMKLLRTGVYDSGACHLLREIKEDEIKRIIEIVSKEQS